MRLDAAAVRAINLFPMARDGSNKTTNLFGLLNHCQTAQGSRLLRQWLSQPLLKLEKIENRLDFVELFFEETVLRRILLEDHLKKMPDFTRLSKKFQKGRAHLQEVVRLYQAVCKLPSMIQSLQIYTGIYAQLLEEHFIGRLQVRLQYMHVSLIQRCLIRLFFPT
jgi:DNA mismatch repair protein MSH2